MIKTSAAVVLLLGGAATANAQIYGKLNLLYACVGIINPQVEFGLSEHSTFQTELVVSPWKRAFGDRHMLFGIFLNEYRYYFKQHNSGFYVGANAGLQIFNMSKLELFKGKIHLQNRYCKGYGYMLGACVGYEHRFRERWLLDAFVGFAYIGSNYNGYSLDGQINMDPHRPDDRTPEYPDPFNGSAEWYPNKIGLSVGYLLFDPQKRKR